MASIFRMSTQIVAVVCCHTEKNVSVHLFASLLWEKGDLSPGSAVIWRENIQEKFERNYAHDVVIRERTFVKAATGV